MNYKLISVGIMRLDDGAFIPSDSKNSDWREYQKWVADGNTPIPKDPDPLPTQEERDVETVRAYPKLHALATLTPAQVSAWVDANINTLADAKDALKTLAMAAGILARRI